MGILVGNRACAVSTPVFITSPSCSIADDVVGVSKYCADANPTYNPTIQTGF